MGLILDEKHESRLVRLTRKGPINFVSNLLEERPSGLNILPREPYPLVGLNDLEVSRLLVVL